MYNLTRISFVMHLQTKSDSEKAILQLEADKAQLQEQLASVNARRQEADRRYEVARRELSEKDSSTEYLLQQISSLRELHDALKTQLEGAERRASASDELAGALDSQLFKTQVSAKCESD
jgi:DNA repair exonuclease SbcCD ATPase subunit